MNRLRDDVEQSYSSHSFKGYESVLLSEIIL